MKFTRMCAVTLLLTQLAACSGNAELDAANAKIASLEAQLTSEKAKNDGASPAKATGKNGGKGAPAPAKATADTTAAPSGKQWSYSADDDKMTGKTVYHAGVSSTNTVNFSFPYSGAQHGSLTLRSGRGAGKDVIFSIEKGQILCHSFQNCNVTVRFDDEKPMVFAADGPADHSTETVFLRGYDKFVAKLRKANLVRISVNIHQQGSPVFEFDVSGFDADKFQPTSK